MYILRSRDICHDHIAYNSDTRPLNSFLQALDGRVKVKKVEYVLEIIEVRSHSMIIIQSDQRSMLSIF